MSVADLVIIMAFLCNSNTCPHDSALGARMLVIEDCSIEKGWVEDVSIQNRITGYIDLVARHVPCVERR